MHGLHQVESYHKKFTCIAAICFSHNLFYIQCLSHGYSYAVNINLIYTCHRICQFLVQRQSSDSENRPLSGLDPTIHAGVCILFVLMNKGSNNSNATNTD